MRVPYYIGESELIIAAGNTIYNLPQYYGSSYGSTTGAQGTRTCRNAGMISRLRIHVTGVPTNPSSFTMRINGVDANNSISGIAATGIYEDTTHFDYIKNGDTFSIKIVVGSGGIGLYFKNYGYMFTSDDCEYTIGSHGTGSFNHSQTGVVTNFFKTHGAAGTLPTGDGETVQLIMKNAGIRKNMIVRCGSNGRSSTSVFRSRINGAYGNLSVSFAAATTGTVEDVSNVDTYVVDDLVNNCVDLGSGSGTLAQAFFITDFFTLSRSVQLVNYCLVGQTVNPGLTRYNMLAGRARHDSVETNIAVSYNIDFTLSNFMVYVGTNGISNPTTFRVRKNGSNGNSVLTFNASETGWKEDTSNTDVCLSTDEVGYSIVTGSGGTNIGMEFLTSLMTFDTYSPANFFMFF